MPIAGYKGSVNIASPTNVALSNYVLTDAGDHKTFNVPSADFGTKRYWDRTVVPVIQAEYDEVQSVTITGSPTGGTFTLTFGGQTTSALNWNATAAQMQTALQALSSIGANNALVTGGPGPGTAFQVEFAGTLGFAGQALITLTTNSLTGGTSPSVAIARTQAGAGWTTQSASLYSVRYVTGQVLFASAFLGTQAGCRLSSGAYLPFSTFSNMSAWEINLLVDLLDSSTLGVGWHQYTPSLQGAEIKLSNFYTDLTFANEITAGTAFIVSCMTGRNAYERYEGFAHLKTDDLKVEIKSLETEALNYSADNQFYYFAGQYA